MTSLEALELVQNGYDECQAGLDALSERVSSVSHPEATTFLDAVLTLREHVDDMRGWNLGLNMRDMSLEEEVERRVQERLAGFKTTMDDGRRELESKKRELAAAWDRIDAAWVELDAAEEVVRRREAGEEAEVVRRVKEGVEGEVRRKVQEERRAWTDGVNALVRDRKLDSYVFDDQQPDDATADAGMPTQGAMGDEQTMHGTEEASLVENEVSSSNTAVPGNADDNADALSAGVALEDATGDGATATRGPHWARNHKKREKNKERKQLAKAGAVESAETTISIPTNSSTTVAQALSTSHALDNLGRFYARNHHCENCSSHGTGTRCSA